MLPGNRIILFLLCCLGQFAMYGQVMDNTLSFKNINNDSYFRFNVEDDYFDGTDDYYTGGLHAELAGPWARYFPLSKILFHPRHSKIRYGLGIEDDLYTPVNIAASNIQWGDRPYAACLFLKTFAVAIDSGKKQRVSTILSTGVIGPAAGAMDLQTTIHRALPDNIIPRGWGNQVHNDVILNYQVDYEKQLQSLGRLFSLDADGMARAGTLSDKIGAGITAMAGYFDSPFGNVAVKKRNLRFYVYEHPEIDVIGYDATLEGGVFDHSSLYTIAPGKVRRFTFLNRYGLVCVFGRFYIECAHTFLSNEINNGATHAWGSLQIAYGF